LRSDYGFRIVGVLFVALVFALCVIPYSYSKGASQWSFYGNVTDGATCRPLAGVLVTAAYNGNVTNITNSSGGYLVRLGYGSWNVTFSKSGYQSLVYTTPSELEGSYGYDLYLAENGKVPVNCSLEAATSSSSIAATTIENYTTIAQTNIVNHSTGFPVIKNRYSFFGFATGLFVIIVLALLLAAYVIPKIRDMLRRKPKSPRQDDAPRF
jgi:uncharacterized membrane protein